jgi:hypothetical protein
VYDCYAAKIPIEACITTVQTLCKLIEYDEIDAKTFVESNYKYFRTPVAFSLRVKVLKPHEMNDYRKQVEDTLGDDVIVEIIQ